MPYNYSKLLGRIVELCGTQAVFSQKMQLSERSVSLKLNGKRAWKQLVKLVRYCIFQKRKLTNIFLRCKFNIFELTTFAKRHRKEMRRWKYLFPKLQNLLSAL